jgi:crotonobetainyl-CoA:carnitine CoA-transferase CaiB-like acyl-CoA transferase
LDGVRVIDLSRVLAAPFAGRVFAELGAQVVKVEYGAGDPAHAIGPHWGDRSLYYSSLNSGKEEIWLDLRQASDRDALHELLAGSDVLLENFKSSTAASLDLEPGPLLQRHPRLIVTSVTGYGRDSERSDEGAFDLTTQAESGIMSLTGETGGVPLRAGVPICDLAAGMWAVAGTLGALYARERDGKGRHVEVPLLDAALPLLAYVGTTALATDTEPGPVGTGHHNACPYGAFETRDGWIVIGALSDKLWVALCAALGLQDLSRRRDLDTNAGRAHARVEVDGAVGGKVAELTSEEALARLTAAGVPNAPVNGVIDALTAPYAAQRGCVQRIEAPEGSYSVVTSPLKQEGVTLGPAPALGRRSPPARR